MAQGHYFLYPDPVEGFQSPGPGMASDFRAARALAHKQAMEEENQRRNWANLDRQNHLVDLQVSQLERQKALDEQKRARQEIHDQIAAQQQMSDMLNPSGPNFNPAMAANLGQGYGINVRQTNLPQQPNIPSIGNPPPELADVLHRGDISALVDSVAEPQPRTYDVPTREDQQQRMQAEQPRSRPPTTEEFRRYAGGENAVGQERTSYDVPTAGEQQAAQQQQQQVLNAFHHPDYQAAAQSYLAQRKQGQADQASYDRRLGEAQGNPTYEGTSPLGPVRMAPVENYRALTAMREREAGKLEAEANGATDPYVQRELLSVAEGMRSGRIAVPGMKPEAGQVPAEKALEFLYGQRNQLAWHQASEANKDRRAAMEVRKGDANLEQRDRSNTTSEHTQLLATLKDWKATAQIQGNLKDYRQAIEGLGNVTSANSVRQRAAIYAAGRRINGAGVFSNQDAKEILGSTGGLAQSVADAISKAENGEFDPATTARFSDALLGQINVTKTRIADAGRSFDALAADPHWANYQPSITAYRNSVFGLLGEQARDVGRSTQPPAGSRLGPGARGASKANGSVKIVGGPNDDAASLVKALRDALGAQQ